MAHLHLNLFIFDPSLNKKRNRSYVWYLFSSSSFLFHHHHLFSPFLWSVWFFLPWPSLRGLIIIGRRMKDEKGRRRERWSSLIIFRLKCKQKTDILSLSLWDMGESGKEKKMGREESNLWRSAKKRMNDEGVEAPLWTYFLQTHSGCIFGSREESECLSSRAWCTSSTWEGKRQESGVSKS